MNIKRIFITGVIFLLPTLITIFVISLALKFLNIYFAQPLGAIILSILHLATGLSILKEQADLFRAIIGFPVALGIIILVGYLAVTFLGQRILAGIEKYLLQKFPVVSFIYPYAKQFIDTFWKKDKQTEFKSVVAVEYPRKGIYSIGFITSEGIKEVNNASGKELVTVFVPNSPTPFTGFTILFPKEEVISLNMTVDEAIRFVVSGGILTPSTNPDGFSEQEPGTGNGASIKEAVPSGTPPQQ
jgi:uncharacterized membrane protein